MANLKYNNDISKHNSLNKWGQAMMQMIERIDGLKQFFYIQTPNRQIHVLMLK